MRRLDKTFENIFLYLIGFNQSKQKFNPLSQGSVPILLISYNSLIINRYF